MNNNTLSQLPSVGPGKPRARRNPVLLGLGAVVLSLLGTSTGTAQIAQISHQSWVQIAKATGTDSFHSEMNNPRALYFDIDGGSGNNVKKVFVNWQANKDFAPWPYYHGFMSSTNGGSSYGSKITSPEVDMMAAAKKRDGTLVTVPFFPFYPMKESTDGLHTWSSNLPNTTFTSYYDTSTDNGATWTVHGTIDMGNGGSGTIINGTVITFPQTCLGMRFHRGMIEENNGDLYAPVYVRFNSDTVFRSVLMKSTNGGQAWNYVSTIQFTSTLSYTETTVARCADGSWLAVMRNDDPATSTIQNLKQKRSTDKGVTWGSVVFLPGLSVPGVDPNLTLLPNGLLVLSYGIQNAGTSGRNVRMAFSADGNGTTWTNDTVTFTAVDGVSESTGYTSIIPTTAHRFLQITDTGISWSYSTEFPGGTNPYATNQMIVDVVRTQRNRIDLANKVAAGAVTITTDMTYSNATHPEARTSAAYDGSSAYWSGAFKSATTGSYTIDLQANKTLTSVGVCLQYNTAESATVAYSTNGTSWTTIKTYTNAVHNAINYTDGTITARYVRVNVTGGTSPISVNEVELYTRADTFENYAYGIVPYGYTSPNNGFWVTDAITPLPSGYQSNRSLVLYDGQTGAQPTITKTTTATASKTLEFNYRSKTFATSGAHQFIIRSGTTNVYQMAVFSDGSIRYYNATTWVSVAGASTVPADSWTLIKAVATISPATASIYVNGVLKGTAGKVNTGPTTMDNFMFASSGTLPTGDEALLDDIDFY